MSTPITISGAPVQFQAYLRKGDAAEGDFDGKVSTDKGAQAAYGACTAEKGVAGCGDLLGFLEKAGYKPKVEKAEAGGAVKGTAIPVKGYAYKFPDDGSLVMRVISDGEWRLFSKGEPLSVYAGFGFDYCDVPGKEKFQIPANGLKYVVFTIEGPSVPEFKVEINGNELSWLKAGTTGEVRMELTEDLFPQGKLCKFQIITKPGVIDFTIRDIKLIKQ